jgi:hypothetical protein
MSLALGHTCCMVEGFQDWVSSLIPRDRVDPAEPGASATAFLREIFDEHRALTPEDVQRRARERQIELAREAVGLVSADIRSTTDLEPPPFEYRLDGGAPRIAYWGRYAPSPIIEFTAPGVICEVSDFMQDEISTNSAQAGQCVPTMGWAPTPG